MKMQNTITDIKNFLATGKPAKPRPMARLYVDGKFYKAVPFPTDAEFKFPDKITAELFISKIVNR